MMEPEPQIETTMNDVAEQDDVEVADNQLAALDTDWAAL